MIDDYEDLVVETFGSVLRVTLNRPDRRNALSVGLMEGLFELIDRGARDESIRVLVVRGAGTSFCSGWDVAPTATDEAVSSPHARMASVERDNRTFDALWRCPIPTIAQVHGYCLAAGTDLALSCDFVVCATDAVIGYPAVRSVGGVPATHMWLYNLGPQWTKRLLLTGDRLTGAKAAELGLALEAVDVEALDAHVMEFATRIGTVPRDSLIANKSVVNCGLELIGRSQLQRSAVIHNVLARSGPDAAEFSMAAQAKGARQAAQERDAPFVPDLPIA